MKTDAIPLNEHESAMLVEMKLRQEELTGDFTIAERNGELACALMKSLLARNAIPQVRLRYFEDPTFRDGYPRGSRKQLFERNERTGDDIYRHPNFLAHLRYFLFGAELPPAAFEEFSKAILACGQVGPSDSLDLGKLARKLTRRFGLTPVDVADEFYKLALDCGVYQGHAKTIRKIVYETR